MMAFSRQAAAAAAVILLLTSCGLGEGRQLFLNVYVDESPGKALIVGNIDESGGLTFLEGSESVVEDNGQIYAVSSTLVQQEGEGWRIDFPASGGYEQYHAVFLVSGGFSFKEINCSEGLEILTTSYNGSIILDVQGFDLIDPQVSFKYALE